MADESMIDQLGSDRVVCLYNMSELQPPDVDGSDYSRLLAGHLGHLTPSQEESLEAFKQSLHKADLYNPKGDDGGPPSHDDTTLLCVHNLPPHSGSVHIPG